jgi:antitoxin component of MazEF toxin-antitoxin module
MLTKRLTKIGDSTGLVIDKPILDLLGLARGDEVELRLENERLIVGPVDASVRAERHRVKFAKAKAHVHKNLGRAMEKLAK